MKLKSAVCLLLAMMLVPISAFAAPSDTANLHPLYPARVNGLWGYIDDEGRMVIEPEYTGAGEFRNGYAAVTVPGDGDYKDGIIDRSGTFVVEPVYMLDQGYDGIYYGSKDAGVIWLWDETGAMGFFNVATGFFSGLVWGDGCHLQVGDARLIAVDAPDGEAHWRAYIGYADRSTGELVIPYRYSHIDGGGFSNGFALVEVSDPKTEDTENFFIDETGKRLALPEGIVPDYWSSFCDGLTVVYSTETGLYGYIDTTGAVAIAPQFELAADFHEGYAAVESGGLWGHIDRKGNWVQKPKYICDIWGYTFVNGLATAEFSGVYGVIDTKGNMVFTLPDAAFMGGFMDNGLVDFGPKPMTEGYNCFGLADREGNIILDPDEGYRFEVSYAYGFTDLFPDGLQVLEKDGKYGFIDESGKEAIAFEWDDAENFANGLAYVVKGGKMAYINHEGKVVWQEK